jgi:hypothetical protein
MPLEQAAGGQNPRHRFNLARLGDLVICRKTDV